MAEDPKATKQSRGTGTCLKCNKRLRRKTWYYRNGGFYCSKRCWKLIGQVEKK